MYFNLKKEKMKLRKHYASLRKVMLDAGMSEKEIRELYLLDLRQLYSDYQFYSHLDHYLTPEQESRLIDDNEFDIMDERLKQVLDELKPENREVILLHIVEGWSLPDIACLLDEPFETVKSRFYRNFKKISEKVHTIWSSTSHI
ncbi:MAG: sigma factor-like helix-turn-helix DNA-binding protein [Christensenellaceae bacterium]|jgi:RNA polymerase sigma factor (sigma-70 family)